MDQPKSRVVFVKKELPNFDKLRPAELPAKAALTVEEVWLQYYDLPAGKSKERLREFLFKYYTPKCRAYCRSYMHRKMPSYSLLEEDDLVQAALAILWTAIPKYNPRLGFVFWNFFNAKGRSYIYGAIIDCLRGLQDFPRRIAKQKRLLGEQFILLRQIIQREPSLEDFCDFFGWDKQVIVKEPMLWQSVFNQSVKADGDGADGEGWCDEYRFANSQNTGDKAKSTGGRGAITEGVARKADILHVIGDCDARYAVFAYYWLGYTNKQIAKYLKCSVSTALERKNEGERIIAEHFTRESLGRIVEQA